MKAPVKMLFPLLVFIFPCTFVLLFFPVVVRLLESLGDSSSHVAISEARTGPAGGPGR